MAKATPDRPFTPSGFFAFRTPLLPFEELEAFGEGLEAPAAAADTDGNPEGLEKALAADRERLRARLAALAERPEVLEAVFLASPSLYESLAAWRAQPDNKKGQRAERALVRYIYRMIARATPFGLFSGCSLGPVESAPGSATRIAVGPRAAYERHTRLDMDYLFALCEDLARDPAVRAELVYRPNSSLYRAAGRLRYAEARLEKKVRSHHLVAVDSNDYLEEALRRAEGGARAREIAEALVAFDPDGEVTIDEASEFVTELIDSQILVSDLSTPVTGPEAIHGVIEQLTRIPATSQAAGKLARIRTTLEELDAGGPGAAPARYEEVAEALKELPTPVEMSRLFQLDMVKPADQPALGAAVLEEIQRGVEVLLRLAVDRPSEGLERFRKEFNERFESREVPLLQALDEEVGIGFERSGDFGAEASPLLRGIGIGGAAAEQTVAWGRTQAVLLSKLNRALAEGERRIEITPEDLDRMAPPDSPQAPPQTPKPPLPDAFHVMVTLAAASQEAIDRGEFQILFENAGGPSGARLLGRFCHADAELSRQVEEHLRAEETHRADAVFAEVVHLPQGRIGNILARPVLREYEIPFLGLSGAPPERQIPINDLRVSVQGSRVVLRSARLGKEVIPRLTSAHNFWHGSLGVYRFLCMLQSQGVLGGVTWSWGPLDSAPFLPRVTCGRLVLARATWWMPQEEIKELAKAKMTGAERHRAVQAWRERRNLPRLVSLVDADNELLIDLDNVLSIDTFLDVIEERDRARLVEFFPGPDLLAATGPEGRFLNEILVPFVRKPKASQADAAVAATAGQAALPTVSGMAAAAPARRSFPPGSEWLYAKLYTGTATADGLLREIVAPVARETLAAGETDGWFFIRYGDPEWHLRLRFHGDPARLQAGLLPRLHAAFDPHLADGRIWRVQLDTYEREIERYGGPEGILLSERLFQVDSDAVLAILEMLEGDEGADFRWRLALRGIDMLLGDLRFDMETRMRVLRGMREGFSREFGGGKGLRVQLDQRFRQEWRSLMPLLDPAGDAESELAPALAVLRQRSERSVPIVDELLELQRESRLNQTLADLAPSYVHMHVNRIIRSAQRAHEMVLYDFLYLLYESRAARERKGGAGREEKGA
ncbi:MAG TPA: lantibiotic dehydratase [Thermoanaerobaculia bacterium]|jgi:thiopeptide-type bacteriocin biosynthesis protein